MYTHLASTADVEMEPRLQHQVERLEHLELLLRALENRLGAMAPGN